MRWKAFPLNPKENDTVEMNKFLFCPMTLHIGTTSNTETRWLETATIVYKYTYYKEWDTQDKKWYTYGSWKTDHWYLSNGNFLNE